MTPRTLIDLVKKEADNIRANATPLELKSLRHGLLQPTSSRSCVYGLMTGDCFNSRALDLISHCTEKKINSKQFHVTVHNTCDVKDHELTEELGVSTDRNWSPIEAFIGIDENMKNGNNKALVDYITGVSSTLDLKIYKEGKGIMSFLQDHALMRRR